MLKQSRLALILAGSVVFLTQAVFAQGWYTVDDFQYSPGKFAVAQSMAKDPTGTIIYSAGYGVDASGVRHALVFETVNGGTNWSPIEDYTGAADSITFGGQIAMASDPFGNLYASAFGTANGSNGVWFTRSLPAGSSTWSMVDLMTLTNGGPTSMATDSVGNIYVVGASGSDANWVWLVRKGTPSSTGISWANVDAFSSPNGSCFAEGVFCHPTAGVFVVGASPSAWTVRRSQDGGTTWATVDTFQFGNYGSGAQCVGGDAAGNVYVVGTATEQYQRRSSTGHWIVRKSANPNALSPSWSTVDDFQLSAGSGAFAQAFASDANGNLFAAGRANDGVGTAWVVRESVGGAGAWQTVDTFDYSGLAWPKAALGDSLGNVFVAGFLNARPYQWVVRKN
jgi:hypothetical protein